MTRRLPLALGLVLVGCAHQGPPRGADFWLSLGKAKFALPEGLSREEVLTDAVRLVDEPDPALRDEVGYGLVVQWVYREHAVPASLLEDFTSALLTRMKRQEGDGLGRSFAALSLSIVAAAELQQPLLSGVQFDALVDAAISELTNEADLRGHEPSVGWIHATAHTADLLKFLARDSRLTASQQERLLDAVLRRLERGPVFAWGEDERLAAVLRSVVMRDDARLEPLKGWILNLPVRSKALWSATVLDPAHYARLANAKQTLRALFVALSATAPSPTVDTVRAAALETLVAL